MLAPQEECYCDMPQNWQLFCLLCLYFSAPVINSSIGLQFISITISATLCFKS